MDQPPMRLRCACGWEATGSEAELIAAAEEHGRRVHNMQPTRDEVLAMVVDDQDATSGSVSPPPG